MNLNRRQFITSSAAASTGLLLTSLTSFAEPIMPTSQSGYSLLIFATSWGFDGSMDEFDVAYTTNLTESLNLGATYAYMNADVNVANVVADEDINVVRVVARYNF